MVRITDGERSHMDDPKGYKALIMVKTSAARCSFPAPRNDLLLGGVRTEMPAVFDGVAGDPLV